MTVFRDNREPDPGPQDAAQIAESANLTTKTPPVGVGPSVSNEQWLADSINELKTKDAEYLRLQSEQAREQWETLARTNLERQREQESNRAEHTQLQLSQRDAIDAKNNRQLFEQVEELANQLRINHPNGYTAQTLPQETLRSVVQANQRWQHAAELAGVESPEGGVIPITWNPQDAQPSLQTPQQSAPAENRSETFPDGQLYQLTNNPDGTIEVKLATGERFVGDPLTVTQKIAEAKVHTTRYAQDLKQKLKSQPNGNNALPDSTNGNAEVPSFGEWAADEQARVLGFKDRNELVQWGENITRTLSQQNEFIEQQKMRATTADFMRRCPDFPGTQQAIVALGTMIEKNGWDTTSDNMEAAHAHLVRTRVYAPLTPADQQATLGVQAQNRLPPPPPMIRSDAPDATNRDIDLWTEPLAAQRARIIREQLAQKGL